LREVTPAAICCAGVERRNVASCQQICLKSGDEEAPPADAERGFF
jgi:hypothetical protein